MDDSPCWRDKSLSVSGISSLSYQGISRLRRRADDWHRDPPGAPGMTVPLAPGDWAGVPKLGGGITWGDLIPVAEALSDVDAQD